MSFTAQWIRNFKVCDTPGRWRLLKLFYEKTEFFIGYFEQPQLRQMLPKFVKTIETAPRTVHDSFLKLLLNLLKTPNYALRSELLDMVRLNLATSDHSQYRLLFLNLCERSSGRLSKNIYSFFFSENLNAFNKESQSNVAQKFCDLSVTLALNCDYELVQ